MENSEESCTEPYYPSIDEELVGFDDNAENITKYLISGEKDLDVVSIVGMAGLGKTALARNIYNSRSIIDHFDVRAWCSVSQTYNRRELYVDILKQMTDDHHKYVDVAHLADILQKCLCVRKYLIVLDNIWDGKAWDDIQLCAPYSGKGSRIMVTTRNEESALYMRKYSDPYLLPFLNDEKSWELLQKRVFQRGNSCPLELVNVGQLVAKKCKGFVGIIDDKQGREISKGEKKIKQTRISCLALISSDNSNPFIWSEKDKRAVHSGLKSCFNNGLTKSPPQIKEVIRPFRINGPIDKRYAYG